MTTTAAQPPSDRIRLAGLSARGRHGVLPFEREEGQLFVVDVTMDVGVRGTAVAAVTDSLEDSVDYAAVAGAVVEVVEGPPVNLLETLAERIGDAVLAFPRVEGVEVAVHKPQAPLDVAFDDVCVTIVRDAAAAGTVPAAAPAASVGEGAAEGGLDVSDEDLVGPGPVPSPEAGVPSLEVPELTAPAPAATWDDAAEDTAAPGSPAPGEDGAGAGAAPGEGASDDATAVPADPVPAWPSAGEAALAAGGVAGAAAPVAGAAALAAGGAAVTASGALAEDAAVAGGGAEAAPEVTPVPAPDAPDLDVAEARYGEDASAAVVSPAPEPPAPEPPAPEPPAAVVPPAPVDVLAARPAQPVGFVIALGGNVGGVVPALRKAVHTLEDTAGIEVTDLAPLARTAAAVPEGRPAQPDYLNTVVVGLTALSPRELLGVCRDLEAAAGRVRTEPKGPRTLDADLVTVDGVTSSDPELTLPHPRAAERAFVLVPWAQADPFAELGGRSVADLAEEAPDRDGVRWLALDWLTSDRLPALPTGQYVAPPSAPESSEDAAPEVPAADLSAPEQPDAEAGGGADQDEAPPRRLAEEPAVEPHLAEEPAAGTPVPPVAEAGPVPEATPVADAAAADAAGDDTDDDTGDDGWTAPPAWGDVVSGGGGTHGARLWPGRENRGS